MCNTSLHVAEFQRGLDKILRKNLSLPPRTTLFKNEVFTGYMEDSNSDIPHHYLNICIPINNELSKDLLKIYNIVTPCMQINLYKLEMTRAILGCINYENDTNTVINFIVQLTSLGKGLTTPREFSAFCIMLAAPPNWSFVEAMIKYLDFVVLLKNPTCSVLYNKSYTNKTLFIFEYADNIVTFYYGKQMTNEFE